MEDEFVTEGVQIPLREPNEDYHFGSNDEAVDIEFDGEANSDDASISHPPKPRLSKSRARAHRKLANKKVRGASKASLRPANDILARIRHDPAYEENDFVVGYSDRHLPNPVEMDVTAWKGRGEVDEEDWIPQHRIIYFRRKHGSGEKVWDRPSRLDKIFGSGKPESGEKESVDPKERSERSMSPEEHGESLA